MSEASEKQTAILLKNGFSQESIDRMNKASISDEIGKIFAKNKKPQPSPGSSIGATEGIGEVRHLFPNKYETGPAGNRHEIRYWKPEELENQLNTLRNMGLLVDTI